MTESHCCYVVIFSTDIITDLLLYFYQKAIKMNYVLYKFMTGRKQRTKASTTVL